MARTEERMTPRRKAPSGYRKWRTVMGVPAVILVAAVTVSGCALANAAVAGEGADAITGVDELLLGYLSENNIPGATVAVTKNSRLVMSKGYGYANLETKLQMQPQHRTLFGSTSKFLTTVGVMKLVEQGELDLDDHIYSSGVYPLWGSDAGATPGLVLNGSGMLDDPGKYLKAAVTGVENLGESFPPAETPGSSQEDIEKYHDAVTETLNWATKIRLRNLLSHTSGFLRNGSNARAAKEFEKSQAEVTYGEAHRAVLMGKMGAAPFKFEPGTQWSYSNHGFGLTGLVIAETAGTPYVEYMKNEILQPLGLNHVVPRFTSQGQRDAVRYRMDEGNPVPKAHKVLDKPENNVQTGGWAAAAQDFVRVMCALDRGSNNLRILDKGTVKTVETVAFPEVDNNQPLGWDSRTGAGELTKNGKTPYGGAARISKFLPGSLAGHPRDEINVAIGLNVSGEDLAPPPPELLRNVAKAVADVGIPQSYDLFDPDYRCYKPLSLATPDPPAPTTTSATPAPSLATPRPSESVRTKPSTSAPPDTAPEVLRVAGLPDAIEQDGRGCGKGPVQSRIVAAVRDAEDSPDELTVRFHYELDNDESVVGDVPMEREEGSGFEGELGPFSVSSVPREGGTLTIVVSVRDQAGNVEESKSIEVRLGRC